MLQDDGKIVAAGAYGGGGLFALARYNPNGSLDTSFSGDGTTVTAFGSGGARGVALQDDGKIVVAGGTGGLPAARDFALARYNTNGALDTGFSGDGMLRTDIADVDAATGVAVQEDGKIVAVGHADVLSVDHPDTAISGDFALARYNPDGSLDASFSGNGKQTTDFSSASTHHIVFRHQSDAPALTWLKLGGKATGKSAESPWCRGAGVNGRWAP